MERPVPCALASGALADSTIAGTSANVNSRRKRFMRAY